MAHVKTKSTKAEVVLRKALYSRGYRYRINYKKLPGKPDVVFIKKKIAIFVHGCFWHQHPNCKYSVFPKSNIEFWEAKFKENKERDKRNIQQLEELGWSVITVWECEIEKNISSVIGDIVSTILLK
jgi:DNA mismatch endonuclease (patch repair protein)